MKSKIEKVLNDCRNMDIQNEIDTFGDSETIRLAVAEFERLKAVVHAAREVRKAQKIYHKNKLAGDLRLALSWEKEIDKRLDSLWDTNSATVVQDTLL